LLHYLFGRLAIHTAQGMTTTYTVNALDQRMGALRKTPFPRAEAA
jgi:hypothetical protein